MKRKKILVLGATGHLGAYSAIQLKIEGHEVVAVGRRKSDNGFFNTKGITYIGGFILEDASTLSLLPTDIDAIVHLAGTMPAHADASPMPYIQSIIVGMVNLCEWIRTKTKCKRVIFNTTPSDIIAFFNTPIPVKDDVPRSFPKDGGDHAIYAISKNAATDILEHYGIAYGITSCIFRHLTVYGYQPNPFYYINGEKKMLPWRYIIKQAIEGKTIEVWGDPKRKKELLYIKDFTKAVAMAVESNCTGIYNLSGVKPYTLEEQIQGIIDIFSPKNNPSLKNYCPQKSNTPENLLDSTKVKTILGWVPEYDWWKACKDIKLEMETEPMQLLWGKASNFE